MSTDFGLSPSHLREICTLTLELVKLRQNECKHLSIENIAPEIFGRLLTELCQRSQS
ncbi:MULTISPECIES: hypothetical protein [unclassified Cupriavidus]|uniref:hypothetical protein n=1 Tax=unclassified Cupriavidus TaxID=2640874 RepID=UPI001C000EB8|nr:MULTISPECIES: hypothetical protein [unclassified Cupriavidus]MCA3188313.1 hypothetical protein [Cupriavidus sp.]MCA3189833.1 hypothetical protein [Cupriavidus sp.]MCA3196427.1 hypothetical protein [Cupriavidus sp.]MCA3202172.1 hypothetical protein [Cupriavidus sp.]MCA3234327.1 hypothetical protein [Cupriavidus sp.]